MKKKIAKTEKDENGKRQTVIKRTSDYERRKELM